MSEYRRGIAKRTASCSAMIGSRSQAATNCTEEIFLISSTCASAIFPHPTIAIFKLGPFRCNLHRRLHAKLAGYLVFASFRARVQPNQPIKARKRAVRLPSPNTIAVPRELNRLNDAAQPYFRIAKSCTPVPPLPGSGSESAEPSSKVEPFCPQEGNKMGQSRGVTCESELDSSVQAACR